MVVASMPHLAAATEPTICLSLWSLPAILLDPSFLLKDQVGELNGDKIDHYPCLFRVFKGITYHIYNPQHERLVLVSSLGWGWKCLLGSGYANAPTRTVYQRGSMGKKQESNGKRALSLITYVCVYYALGDWGQDHFT